MFSKYVYRYLEPENENTQSRMDNNSQSGFIPLRF